MADAVAENKIDATSQRLRRKPRRSPVRMILLIVLVLALVAAGYFLWQYFGSYESTDDAQIDGHLNAVSARINGQVSEVLVENQQVVKKGDVLIRIDPRDFEIAMAKAEADLADAEATLEGSRTDVPITST